MQKANKGITVQVVSFGNDAVSVTLPEGATVSDALAQANITRTTQEIFVSGEVAEDSDILENGDVLSIVTPKQAGA
jgi:sulfur carrier protein ThiS